MPITLQPHNFTINGLGGVLDSRNPGGVQPNREPEWSAPSSPLNVAPGAVISVAPYASDPDGDALTFARVGGTAPAGITVQPDGTIVVAAGVAAGDYTVVIDADDGRS